MSDFPRWRYWLVAVVLALSLLYAVPNLFQRQPAVQVSANRGATVDQTLESRVGTILRKANVPFDRLELVPGQNPLVMARFDNPNVQLKASDALKQALGENYVVALNLASTVPAWMKSIHADAMRLGLDLQGGVHFLMEVDQQAVRDKQQNGYIGNIRASLQQKKIRYVSVGKSATGVGVSVVLRSSADRDQAASLIAGNYPKLIISNGASSDTRYVLSAVMSETDVLDLAQRAIMQNVGTLRNRINALGVSEPLIQQQGAGNIVVELAGVQDTAEAKKMLGAVATLEYRANYGTFQDAIAAEKTGNIPPEARLYHDRQGRPILLNKKVIATGDELINASSGMDPQTGTPDVSVTLNAAAAKRMFDFTSGNVGKYMGVVYKETIPEEKMVDGKKVLSYKTTEVVINDAVINGVFGNKFSTSGLDSPAAAANLALLLRSGSLAAPMRIIAEGVIGPSLGRDNIQKGLLAIVIGLAAVLLCAGVYYKLFGVVADIALFFNLILLVAVMSLIGVTLTMPGIAGIILALGMAIDANVLICERIREELRNGSTPFASIRAGYEKAWSTILDAHVTHLLAAVALMTFGTGAIRGFGVTLAIGILASLFTSVTVTHALTAAIHGGRKLKRLSV